ncbi:GIY-YIG nuclease family protein [Streptomyces sp. NPDC048209]|uniref:GIY-YIG nuclease family protein n=1 Tax=Streptomyces sp. NPDC048209 TaxID=3156689 RepID=UPI0034237BB4
MDQSEPAFTLIAVELQRCRRTGEGLTTEAVEAAVSRGRKRFADHEERLAAMRPGRIPRSIIYYARRSNLVKIGTTTRPHDRFKSLLPDEVLAWEPGGRDGEGLRHQQFRSLRLTSKGEYFRRDDDLDTHIRFIASQFGPPDPTWPTLASLETRPVSAAITPEPPRQADLVTLRQGTRMLGIRHNTAEVWKHRGKLKPLLRGRDGEELFLLSDLKSLATGRRRAA